SRKLATSFPSNKYCPPEGLSSSPMMLSSVDFPQPDGPIIATNSPLFTCMFTLFSAVVSTSSVRNTFESSIVLIMVFFVAKGRELRAEGKRLQAKCKLYSLSVASFQSPALCTFHIFPFYCLLLLKMVFLKFEIFRLRISNSDTNLFNCSSLIYCLLLMTIRIFTTSEVERCAKFRKLLKSLDE